MIEITLFSDDWYHKIIEQARSGFGPDVSDDAVALATSIMVAGCCIAQSLDHISDHICETGIQTDVEGIVEAVKDIAEAVKAKGE